MAHHPRSQQQQNEGAARRPSAVSHAVLGEFIDHQMEAVSVREVVATTAGMVVVCALWGRSLRS